MQLSSPTCRGKFTGPPICMKELILIRNTEKRFLFHFPFSQVLSGTENMSPVEQQQQVVVKLLKLQNLHILNFKKCFTFLIFTSFIEYIFSNHILIGNQVVLSFYLDLTSCITCLILPFPVIHKLNCLTSKIPYIKVTVLFFFFFFGGGVYRQRILCGFLLFLLRRCSDFPLSSQNTYIQTFYIKSL